MGPSEGRRFDWRRAAVLAAVAGVAIGAWLLVSRLGDDGSISVSSGSPGEGSTYGPAVMVETPRSAGQEDLKVASQVGALAPDFEASDLDGRRFRLSDYRGQPLLVNFWATWCTSCKAEMPAMQAVLDEHRSEGFTVLAVNMGDGPGPARRYLEDLGLDFDVALDPELTVAREYRIVGLPVSYFIDRGGVIRRVRFGEMSQEMIEAFVQEVLGYGNAKAVSSPSVPAAAAPAPPAGEPAVLRITPNIEGPGSLLLQSPSFRCAIDFCAGYLLQDLRSMPGVTYVNSRVMDRETGEWGFLVRYDKESVAVADIVQTYQRSLVEHPDPLYPAPHGVEEVPLED